MPFSKAALQKRAGSMESMEPPLARSATDNIHVLEKWTGFDANHKITS